jgi:hypothetical protein
MRYDQTQLSENANHTNSMLNRFENKLSATKSPSLKSITNRALLLVSLKTSGYAVANVQVNKLEKLKSSFSNVGLSLLAKNESEVELNVVNKIAFKENERQVIESMAELYESNQLQVEPLFGMETTKGETALRSLSEEIGNMHQINNNYNQIHAPQNKM